MQTADRLTLSSKPIKGTEAEVSVAVAHDEQLERLVRQQEGERRPEVPARPAPRREPYAYD
jgi:hypothetical protein